MRVTNRKPTLAGASGSFEARVNSSTRQLFFYRSNSAATTLIEPRIATTSLTMWPSVIFAIDE
jgi:hypothetical protein